MVLVSSLHFISLVSPCHVTCFFSVYCGGMWACVIIYSLCLSSQCVGVVSKWEAGHSYISQSCCWLFYTAYIIYTLHHSLLHFACDLCLQQSGGRAAAPLVNNVRTQGCFQLQISRLYSNLPCRAAMHA